MTAAGLQASGGQGSGLPPWVAGDIMAINGAFADRSIGARVLPGGVLVAGRAFVVYRLQLARGETVRRVASMVADLAETVSTVRGASSPVRLRSLPLALELPHVSPAGISAGALPLAGLPVLTGALGRAYDWSGVADLLLSLDRFPHVLIAAQSGGGKSTLLRSFVLSLAACNSPAGLAVVLLDGKNENGDTIGALPHTVGAAWSASGQVDLLRQVGALLDDRIAQGGQHAGGRVLVVVDELLSLVDAGGADLLARIMTIGRSLGVHVCAASQYVTAAAVGGIVKANFAARLVGRVSSAPAAMAAAGIGETGAEKLAGRGAFLAVTGDRVVRFQSYNVTAGAAVGIVGQVAGRWAGVSPVALPSLAVAGQAAGEVASGGGAVVATDEIARIASILAPVAAGVADGSVSLAAAIRLAYGGEVSTGGSYRRRVLAALGLLASKTQTAGEVGGGL